MEHLQSCTLFQSLDASTLLRVAESTKSILVHQHERVIKQGDVGHEFFSIKSGEVSVWVNNQSQQHVKQKVKQKQQKYVRKGKVRKTNTNDIYKTTKHTHVGSSSMAVFASFLAPSKSITF
jgi:CRP-like cAMP-binding protein